MKQLPVLAALVALAAVPGAADDYYVDRAASGSGSGTSWANAWTEIDRIDWGRVGPGDTVYVAGGSSRTYRRALQIGNSGRVGNPIRVVASEEPGREGPVRLTGTTDLRGIEVRNRSYIEIEGFYVSGKNVAVRVDDSSHITLENIEIVDSNFCFFGENSSYVTLRNAAIHNNRDSGSNVLPVSVRNSNNLVFENVESYDNTDFRSNSDCDGFHILFCENVLFENCRAANNSEDGFDLTGENVRIVNSEADSNGRVGMKLWRRSDDGFAPKDYTVHNSISRRNGERGLVLAEAASVRIYNSVFYDNAQTGLQIFTESGRQAVFHMYNSIVANQPGGLSFQPADPSPARLDLDAENNLWYRNGTAFDAIRGPIAGARGSIEGEDPRFVYPPAGNFRLEPGSPAIDAGQSFSAIGELSEGKYGVPRPQGAGWDIGAAEYDLRSGAPPPPADETEPPSGIRIQ